MSQLDYLNECHGCCERCKYQTKCEVCQKLDELCNCPEEKITESDIWYAMTDGMYGDYPGGDVDPEMFGF